MACEQQPKDSAKTHSKGGSIDAFPDWKNRITRAGLRRAVIRSVSGSRYFRGRWKNLRPRKAGMVIPSAIPRMIQTLLLPPIS